MTIALLQLYCGKLNLNHTMSYAIIKTGGKQYKVKSGEILKIEKLPDSKPDSKIEFNEVLAYGDDKTIEIGTPTVVGAKVEADLIKNSKDRTILIFKISPDFTLYCFPPVFITAYDIVWFNFKLSQYSCR